MTKDEGRQLQARRWFIALLFLLLALLVLAIVHSYRLYFAERREHSLQDLRIELQKEEDRYAQLLEANDELNTRRNQLWKQMLSASRDRNLRLELDKANILGALMRVEGRGISVELDDKRGYDPSKDSLLSLIHDYYLRLIVQDLVNEGAQAIAVNDQRLGPQSALQCIGTTIFCNGERLIPPYRISAIGPQEKMLKALQNNHFLQQITQPPYYVRLTLTAEDHIECPALRPEGGLADAIRFLEVWQHD